MSFRWLLVPLLVLLLSSIAFSQKLINGFARELAIQGLPAGFSVKSFDVTGDSVSDLFVFTSNKLQVFDGKTFSMIFKDSAAPGTANLSSADVNEDGTTDLVTSSSDTAIVVWYGPDFSVRRLFDTPRRGFGAFAVRNRRDGRVEFSFGFAHHHSSSDNCIGDDDGHILRYIDTNFIFTDSIHLAGIPLQFNVISGIGSEEKDFLLITRDDRYGSCHPNFTSWNLLIQYMSTQVSTVASFLSFCRGPCSPYRLQTFTLGNIDSDSGLEVILFVNYSSTGLWTTNWYFNVYDLNTDSSQWSRQDSLLFTNVFVLDINGDDLQELLTYEARNKKPALVEYQTSNGTTLGFTELPFATPTLLVGQFGQPPVPEVLLGQGDSLVVYRICSATTKGDLNADGSVTVFDVTLQLNCVFLNTGNCDLCFADVNCNGILSTVDVVLELFAVFLQRPFPCS